MRIGAYIPLATGPALPPVRASELVVLCDTSTAGTTESCRADRSLSTAHAPLVQDSSIRWLMKGA